MRITVRLFGTLKRLSQPGTPGRWQADVPEGTTIEALITLLGTRTAEVYAAQVNGELRPLEFEIPDGAEVILVTPFGGG